MCPKKEGFGCRLGLSCHFIKAEHPIRVRAKIQTQSHLQTLAVTQHACYLFSGTVSSQSAGAQFSWVACEGLNSPTTVVDVCREPS